MTDDPTEWWTVPQAAAWIRARDYDLVRGLDPRAELPMAAADATAPGAWEARHLLKAALAHDRFSARGRLALRQITDTDTGASWRYLDTEATRIPLSFWTNAGGDFEILSDGVAAKEPGELEYWADVTIAADDCVVHWPHPPSRLEGGGVNLADIAAELHPQDRLEWWLTHPDVTVTGLDAAGVRVPIDRTIFGGHFALDGNSLTAEGFRWPSAMVCLADDAPQGNGALRAALLRAELPTEPQPAAPHTVAPAVAAPRQPRKRGTQQPTEAEVVAWYRERVAAHPTGRLPPSRSDDEAAARQYFNGIGMDGRGLREFVRQARKDFAPQSWQERGAKDAETLAAHRKAGAAAV